MAIRGVGFPQARRLKGNSAGFISEGYSEVGGRQPWIKAPVWFGRIRVLSCSRTGESAAFTPLYRRRVEGQHFVLWSLGPKRPEGRASGRYLDAPALSSKHCVATDGTRTRHGRGRSFCRAGGDAIRSPNSEEPSSRDSFPSRPPSMFSPSFIRGLTASFRLSGSEIALLCVWFNCFIVAKRALVTRLPMRLRLQLSPHQLR